MCPEEEGWTHIGNPGREDRFHRPTGCDSGSGKEENTFSPPGQCLDIARDDKTEICHEKEAAATFHHRANEYFRSVLAEVHLESALSMLCYVLLCSAVLCCVLLCSDLLCCVLLCSAMF